MTTNHAIVKQPEINKSLELCAKGLTKFIYTYTYKLYVLNLFLKGLVPVVLARSKRKAVHSSGARRRGLYPSCSCKIQAPKAPSLQTSGGGMAHKEALKGIWDHAMLQGRLTDSTVVIKYPMELLIVNLAIIPYRSRTLNLYSTFDPGI